MIGPRGGGARQPGTSTRGLFRRCSNNTDGRQDQAGQRHPGTREIKLAMEKNEVQACAAFPGRA